LSARWRDARLRLLPSVIFLAAGTTLAFLWKDYMRAPNLVGQAESIQANVSSYKAGVVAQLGVSRFQRVKAGDTVGQVLVTDPRILASSLAVIQAEIEMLRVSMEPIANQQRTAMDYSQLRLDWMKQRTQLGMARVNLQLAEADYHRKEELFKDRIVSQRALEESKAGQDRLKKEVDELNWLVDEQTRHFQQLQPTNGLDIAQVSDAPLRAAIAAQETKLRLTEAELAPIILQAPVDGMITAIFHRSGEAIAAGEPIVSVAAANSLRIVGYIRPPVVAEPKVGMRVEVRTRGPRSQVGMAEIIEIGTQFEATVPALQLPVKLATLDLGLPLGISIPSNLSIRPGELVDLTLFPRDSQLKATD
jgi:multidrug resistance efflux pump